MMTLARLKKNLLRTGQRAGYRSGHGPGLRKWERRWFYWWRQYLRAEEHLSARRNLR